MNFYPPYSYSIGYSGHLYDEFEFYTQLFHPLFVELFYKSLFIYQRTRTGKQSIDLSAQSKAIFTFLTRTLSIPSGPKHQTPIPPLIKNSKYNLSFLKGLADSDFCLTFKQRESFQHSYPVISLSSSNKLLASQTAELLRDQNFQVCALFDFPKKRYEKVHISNQLDINGDEQLKLWMRKIGFNSEKHLTKRLSQ